MRHGKAGVKLGRSSSHRKAMFRNMVTSLFKYDRIRTTDAKAKELRSWADRIVTLAKRGDLHARRQALAILREQKVVHKLFDEARERFGGIEGGYTRIVKVGRRPGDAAAMSMIELLSADKRKAPKPEKTAKPEKAPMAAAAAAPAAAVAPAETEARAEEEAQASPEAAAPDAPAVEAGEPAAEEAPETEAKPEEK